MAVRKCGVPNVGRFDAIAEAEAAVIAKRNELITITTATGYPPVSRSTPDSP